MGVERTLLFFGTMITTSCLAFAVCSQFWAEFYFRGKKYHSGLWNICPDNEEDCKSFDDWLEDENTPKWMMQIRVLMSLSVTLSGVAILTSLLGLCHLRVKCYYTSIVAFICSAMLAGSCVIFSEKKFYFNEHLMIGIQHSWGFYLSAATAGWTFLLSIFGIFADVTCKTDQTEEILYGIYADV